MTIDNLKNNWKNSFDEALDSIDLFIKPHTDDDQDTIRFKVLANWMVTTQCSPYDYMPQQWQNFLTNPFKANVTLSMLHHALVDDGDVAFVNLKLENQTQRVFMIFANRHDASFNALCDKENNTLMQSCIQARDAHRRIMNKMKNIHPEKDFDIKPAISIEDFNIEHHHDPIRFIEEVENYQLSQDLKQEHIKQIINKSRNPI